jgi:hypothetical protein
MFRQKPAPNLIRGCRFAAESMIWRAAIFGCGTYLFGGGKNETRTGENLVLSRRHE